MIFEEFAFMKPAVIKATLPVLVAKAALIAITTIGKENKGNNFVSVMVKGLKKSKQPLIRLVEISLICDNCKRKGKERSCQHLMGEIPHWQSSERYDEIQALMGADPETFITELKGHQEDKSIQSIYDNGKVGKK